MDLWYFQLKIIQGQQLGVVVTFCLFITVPTAQYKDINCCGFHITGSLQQLVLCPLMHLWRHRDPKRGLQPPLPAPGVSEGDHVGVGGQKVVM